MMDELNYFTVFCYSFMNVLLIFFVAQFFLMCIAVRKRFEVLNESLKISMKNSASFEAKKFNAVRIGRVYHRLCDAIKIINENFTIPLVALLSLLLVIYSL